MGTVTKTELKGLGYVDWSLFSEDLNLFGVVEPGIRLPADQLEDELVLEEVSPSIEFLVSTLRGWELMSGFRRVSLKTGKEPLTSQPF